MDGQAFQFNHMFEHKNALSIMYLSLRAEATQHGTRIARNSYDINTALRAENIQYSR